MVMLTDQAYILHKRPYQDSSELLRCLTHQHGMVDAIAKGSRNPKSKFKGQLQPFIPVQISLTGKSQLKTVTHAEQIGVMPTAAYLNHVSMLYCNELLLLLNLDQEACVSVFPHYAKTIEVLINVKQMSLVLRKFEWFLCGIQGYQLSLPEGLAADDGIDFDPLQGLHLSNQKQACSQQIFSDFLNNRTLEISQLKGLNRVMKKVVNHLVHGKPIQSRQLLK